MLKFQLPAYQEIPNVGLYLEQTLKYIRAHQVHDQQLCKAGLSAPTGEETV